MRKIRKLSLLGILGVVICALIFIGISSLEANSIGEKPDKPGKPVKPPPEEEANWAVRIPTQTEASNDDLMFYGMEAIDGYYENNDSSIKVSVKKNTMAGPWKKYFNFGYAFDFTLTNENAGSGTEPAYQVGFQNVGGLYYPKYPDADKPCCKFPDHICPEGDCSDCLPNCMAAFLEGTHPHAAGTGGKNYQYFWCRVNVFDYDIESMPEGGSYLFGGDPDTDRDASEPGDYLSMVARYRRDCYPEPTYHDVELYRNINYRRADGFGNPHNIEIERLSADEHYIECDGIWRIWVYNTHYPDATKLGYLKVKERYCTGENRIKWYYPMEAKGNFSFYIDFIKIPTTE